MSADLESKVIEGLKTGDCSIERALLVVSGLGKEKEIRAYERKLDSIQEDFEKWCSGREEQRDNNYKKARALFEYFWETKPERYNSEFLLAKVIDNQLDGDKNKKVGNCVGLTSLYSVLGVRLGLDLSVLHNNYHILNLLFVNGKKIVVENISKYGFDERFIPGSKYKKGDLTRLVETAFYNRGIAKADLGDFQGAIRDYDRAIELKPDYASAINNRGVAKKYLRDLQGAIRDYDRAIELKPDHAFAFNNRGVVKHRLGDFSGAIRDYDLAIELKPDYGNAFNNRGNAKANLRDLQGAKRDFQTAHELDSTLHKHY